jgi:hypothetical protein
MDTVNTALRNMAIIYSFPKTLTARLPPTLEAVKNIRDDPGLSHSCESGNPVTIAPARCKYQIAPARINLFLSALVLNPELQRQLHKLVIASGAQPMSGANALAVAKQSPGY